MRCNNGKVEIDQCTAGCVSKPMGTDDVCNHTDGGGPDGGSAGAGGTGGGDSDGGVGGGGNGDTGGGTGGGADDPGSNGPTSGAHHGCSVVLGGADGGGAPGAVLLVMFLFGLTSAARARSRRL